MTAEPGLLEVPVAGGVRLAGRVSEPAGAPLAVVLLWPALGVTASYYDPFCAELAGQGIAVVAADLRGQGASLPRAGRASRDGYQDLAAVDWPAMVAAVRDRFPGLPLYLLGHSIGGQASVLYAAREPKGVDGLVFVAAGAVDHRGFPGLRGVRILLSTQLVALIGTVWGYFPGHRLGFGGRQPARRMRDWARMCRTGLLRPSGADVDYEALLPGVRLPVLAVSVAGDDLAPPTAVDRLCAKLPGARVERRHHAPAGQRPPGHTRWARSGAEIAEQIRAWAAARHGSGTG